MGAEQKIPQDVFHMEIDSYPIEGFKQKETNDLLVAEFGVDISGYQVACMVAFGYRINPQSPKTSQPAEAVFEWF